MRVNTLLSILPLAMYTLNTSSTWLAHILQFFCHRYALSTILYRLGCIRPLRSMFSVRRMTCRSTARVIHGDERAIHLIQTLCTVL